MTLENLKSLKLTREEWLALRLDQAMFGQVTLDRETRGGIDLNSANLAMVIKRDGKGVPLPLAQQDMAQLGRIDGFQATIIEIKPIMTLPMFNEPRVKGSPPLASANSV